MFNSVYQNNTFESFCFDDVNREIFFKSRINSPKVFGNNSKTEVVEKTMSRFVRSPKNIVKNIRSPRNVKSPTDGMKSPRNYEKTVKTVIVEKAGKRIKKTITNVNRPDGTQEIIEEEKEEIL